MLSNAIICLYLSYTSFVVIIFSKEGNLNVNFQENYVDHIYPNFRWKENVT